MTDTYKTLSKPSEISLYKEKGSKFYGYAFPVINEEQILTLIDTLKKEHHKARHWCYAWRLGKNYEQYRINDDGEPSGSAGLPIFGQIQSKELTNVLVVVVRYFGGTKLGVSGLITAYKTASREALDLSDIVVKTIDQEFLIEFSYQDMNKVQRILKTIPVEIVDQQMEMNCTFRVSVRKSEKERLKELLSDLNNINIIDL